MQACAMIGLLKKPLLDWPMRFKGNSKRTSGDSLSLQACAMIGLLKKSLFDWPMRSKGSSKSTSGDSLSPLADVTNRF